jgi:hypothetical protein
MLPSKNGEHRPLSPRVLKPYIAPKVTILTSEAAEERLRSEGFLGNTSQRNPHNEIKVSKETSGLNSAWAHGVN